MPYFFKKANLPSSLQGAGANGSGSSGGGAGKFGLQIRNLGPVAAAQAFFARMQDKLYQPPDYKIESLDPNAWPSPSQPVAPIGPKGAQPLIYPFNVGQNLTYTPRFDAEYSAAELKALSTYPLARICINNIKDVVSKTKWAFQLKAKPGETASQRDSRGRGDEILIQLSRFFECPDGEKDWDLWVREIVEDMLVIDAASVLIMRTEKGLVGALDVTRGETIARYIDDRGKTPRPPDPAYAQCWQGIPRVSLTTDQLVYRPFNIVPRSTASSHLYGLCYDNQTEILTRDRGFVFFRNLLQSDYVATRNPETKEFEWQLPTAWTNESYIGDMYYLKSRAMDLMVTPQHRVLYSAAKKNARLFEKVVSAEEFHSSNRPGHKIPMTSEWSGGVEVGTVIFNRVSPTGHDVIMSGDDYCALMGAYLAEGNRRCAGGIEVAQRAESKGFKAYNSLFGRINKEGPGHNGKAFTCAYRALNTYFDQFGKAADKFIPTEIRNAPARQLKIFWEYYHLGDGSTMVRANESGRGRAGKPRYSSTTISRVMADQLVEIAQKLGFSASVYIRKGGYPCPMPGGYTSICADAYLVRCRYSAGMSVKSTRIFYDGRIYCVTVPNGIVYVRRNGKPAWCGNSITESLAKEIMAGALRLASVLAYYEKGSIPGLLHVVPAGPSASEILGVMNAINSRLSGQLDKRRQIQMMQGFRTAEQGNEQIMQFADPQLSDAFDEQHIRRVCFGYGVSAQRLVRALNRASSEANQDAAEEEGAYTHLDAVSNIINHIVQRKMGFADYELSFQPDNEMDPQKRATTAAIRIDSCLGKINDELKAEGKDPDPSPYANMYGFKTASGWLPLEDAVKAAQMALQAPPSPFGGGGSFGGGPDDNGNGKGPDKGPSDKAGEAPKPKELQGLTEGKKGTVEVKEVKEGDKEPASEKAQGSARAQGVQGRLEALERRLLLRKRFDPSQPRDDGGRWTDTGASASRQGSSHQGAPSLVSASSPVVYTRYNQPSRTSEERSRTAKSTYKPSTARKQRIAKLSEKRVSKALGIQQTGDNAPFDLMDDHIGVEVKTLVDQGASKLTVHPESLARKQAVAAEKGLKTYTVVIDQRSAMPAYYVREGLGSFRLQHMHRVWSEKELREFVQR